MYNSDMPIRAELPSTGQLLRSTVIAILAAIAILVAIVLPAEYAIDPTGIGRALGLAEMGEIKAQLAEEARRDRATSEPQPIPATPRSSDRRSGLVDRFVVAFFIAPAQAQPAQKSDEMKLMLKPGEGVEVKMVMRKGALVNFTWSASGPVNFDLHGDAGGQKTSYKKGRGVEREEGVVQAAFDGSHGWFWRNRGNRDVTLILNTRGEYAGIKRVP